MSKRSAEDAGDGPPEKIPQLDGAADMAGGAGGAAAGAGGGGAPGLAKGGNRIFHPQKPLKLMNHNTHVYTKSFYFKIYANDWLRFTGDSPAVQNMDVLGFMTVIPYQALCMYMSPTEYIELIRNSSYAKIEHADFELEYKAVRTPFDANSTDTAEANGNLQFELKRWDGLEMMMPFKVVDTVGAKPTTYSTVKTYAELIRRLYGLSQYQLDSTSTEWPATMRERGLTWRPMWNFENTASPTSNQGPMYQNLNRLTSCLPVNEFVTEQINTNVTKMGDGYCFSKSYKPKNGILTMASSIYNPNQYTRFGGSTRINQKIRMHDNLPTPDNPIQNNSVQYVALYPTGTGLNVEKTAVVNSIEQETVPGIVWDEATQPYTRANFNTDTQASAVSNIVTTPNQPLYFSYDRERGPLNDTNYIWNSQSTTATNPKVNSNQPICINTPTVGLVEAVTNVEPNATATNDQFWFGYNQDLAAYAVRDLENFDAFTSNHDPPIHHMPSMLIGAIPKTNKDNTIVNATLEFEVKTRIVVKAQHTHPTYVNCAYAPIADDGVTAGFIDPVFAALADNNNVIFRTRWQHNEHDVLLGDNLKYWDKSYGLAAKPTFQELPGTTPMLNKKK